MYILIIIILAILHAFKPFGEFYKPISPFGGSEIRKPKLYKQSDRPVLHKRLQLILKSFYCLHFFLFILLFYLMIYNNLHFLGNEEGNAKYYWLITLVVLIANFGIWLTKKKENKKLKYIFIGYNALASISISFILIASDFLSVL